MGKEWGGMEWNGMGGWAGSARGREKYHRDGTGTIGTGQVLLSPRTPPFAPAYRPVIGSIIKGEKSLSQIPKHC